MDPQAVENVKSLLLQVLKHPETAQQVVERWVQLFADWFQIKELMVYILQTEEVSTAAQVLITAIMQKEHPMQGRSFGSHLR